MDRSILGCLCVVLLIISGEILVFYQLIQSTEENRREKQIQQAIESPDQINILISPNTDQSREILTIIQRFSEKSNCSNPQNISESFPPYTDKEVPVHYDVNFSAIINSITAETNFSLGLWENKTRSYFRYPYYATPSQIYYDNSWICRFSQQGFTNTSTLLKDLTVQSDSGYIVEINCTFSGFCGPTCARWYEYVGFMYLDAYLQIKWFVIIEGLGVIS
jgi:hypothetical protein